MQRKTSTYDDFIIALQHYQNIKDAYAYEKEVKHYLKHGELPCDARYTRLVKTAHGDIVCRPK